MFLGFIVYLSLAVLIYPLPGQGPEDLPWVELNSAAADKSRAFFMVIARTVTDIQLVGGLEHDLYFPIYWGLLGIIIIID